MESNGTRKIHAKQFYSGPRYKFKHTNDASPWMKSIEFYVSGGGKRYGVIDVDTEDGDFMVAIVTKSGAFVEQDGPIQSKEAARKRCREMLSV